MPKLSNRKPPFLYAMLIVGLIVSSLTACSSRTAEKVPQDGETEPRQSLSQDFDSTEQDQENQMQLETDNQSPKFRQAPSAANENPPKLSPVELEGYMEKYIQPYYITGLMYTTWSSPTEIGVDSLIKFYEYNAFDDYCKQMEKENPEELQNATQIFVPAESLEFFITYYFKVEGEYLRQAENYDAATNTYIFPKEFGIGGGPGVKIVNLEKNDSGDLWTFVCSDIHDKELFLTVELIDQDQFYYVGGKAP